MTEIKDVIIHRKKNKPTTATIISDEIYSSGQTVEIYDDNDVLCFRGMVYTKQYAGDIITYDIIGFDKELNEKVSATYNAADTSQEIFQDIIDNKCTYLYRSSSIDPDGSFIKTWSNLQFYNKTIHEIFDLIANSEDAYWWVAPDGKVWCKNITDLKPNDIYYHATENFKSETIGTTGTTIDWVDAVSATGYAIIANDTGGDCGHKKVLKFFTDDASAETMTHNIGGDTDYDDLQVEFFIKSDDPTDLCEIQLRATNNTVICKIRIDDDDIDAYYGAAWVKLLDIIADTYYRIQWRAYDDSDTTKFSIWIDGTLKVDAETAEDNSDVDDIHFITDTAESVNIYIDAFGCYEADPEYVDGDNEKGVCYEGREIASVPSITEILQEINYIKLYGSIVSGTRITATAEDVESQQLHGINKYFDHYPHESDATELGVIAAAILTRTGFTDYPKFVSIAITALDHVSMGKTIRFHFSPYANFTTAAEYYINTDDYDVKRNVHHFKLSNGLVSQAETLGQSEGTKIMTADEEQIDIVGGSVPTVSDVAYDEGTWNANTDPATKNTIRDKIEVMVSDVAYDATSWDDVKEIAPSKNVIRDEIESILGGGDNMCRIATGTYTGNAANNRQITGLGFQPKFLIHIKFEATKTYIKTKHEDYALWYDYWVNGTAASKNDNTVKIIADGFEVNNNEASDLWNRNAVIYFWVAWG